MIFTALPFGDKTTRVCERATVTRVIRALGLLLASALAVGCRGGGVWIDGGTVGAPTDGGRDGDAAPDVPGPNAPGPNALCDMSAVAYCEKYGACEPVAVTRFFGDVTGCEARTKIDCLDSITAADTGLSASSIATCAAFLRVATCEDFVMGNVAPCVPKGARAVGEPCGTDGQCTTGHCDLGTAACGLCAERRGQGGDCARRDDCEPLLDCVGARCVAPGDPGAACGVDGAPCRLGYACGTDGTCVLTTTTVGASCAIEPAVCNATQGLFCDGMTCAKLEMANHVGGLCGWVTPSSIAGCLAAVCSTDAPAAAGTCAPWTGDGQPCSASTTDCQPPARCADGRCRLPDSAACH
jgi:hypothetical protein